MHDLESWHKTELHPLLAEGENPGNHRLRGNDGGQRGQDYHGEQQSWRNHVEKRFACCLRVMQKQRALAEIVQRQRRIGRHKPGALHRRASEMSDVRIKGLAPRDGEQDGSHDVHRMRAFHPEKFPAVMGRQCAQDRQLLREMREAEHRQHGEPHEHDRPESFANALGAVSLH